jgi:hypothetical protein
MGTFTFAATVGLTVFGFRKSSSITGGSITGMDADYTIDCLAEYPIKMRGYSLSSRKPTYIVTLFGIRCAGIAALFSAIKIAHPVKALSSKNTIPLKLII